MTTYHWGMIGTGNIAHEMADALNAVNGEIYGVAARNFAKTQAFAQEKGIAHVFETPEALIADPQLDIIYIATPHTSHYRYIKAALLAGKHVFVEKAITVDADQFDEVQQLAEDKGLILNEGITLFHMPLYPKLKALIGTGQLGDINMIQVNFGSLKAPDPANRFFDLQVAGGALLDIGVYATAFARYFLHRQPNVTLTTAKLFETGVDEQSGIILKTNDGQIAVMSLSFRAKQPKRGIVGGTKGYLEVNDFPRATAATMTTSVEGQDTTETIAAGDRSQALAYEVQDMQRYVDQGHDDGELALSADVAHILDSVRNTWGIQFPQD